MLEEGPWGPSEKALPVWYWCLEEHGNMIEPLWESQVSAVQILLPLQV